MADNTRMKDLQAEMKHILTELELTNAARAEDALRIERLEAQLGSLQLSSAL